MKFITGNAGKFAELKALIPALAQLDIELPEIQSTDAREIIEAKLDAAAELGHTDFIVEDTGLYFDCLNGLPGPLIKWFLKSIGNDGLAELAGRYTNTNAQAITWIGYRTADGQTHFFEGTLAGTIVMPRGEGFGWDPIFQPEGSEYTFGEMNQDDKSAISMRGIAAGKLASLIKVS